MKLILITKKNSKRFFYRSLFFSVLLMTGIFSANASVEFTENKGQWNDQALFRSVLPNGGNVFLTKDGFLFTFCDMNDIKKAHDAGAEESKNMSYKCHTYRVTFKNSSAAKVYPSFVVPGYSNYYIGSDRAKWASHVNSFSEVLYENLYPNIDMKVYSDKGGFKYDLILHPGAKISDIVMHEDGVENIFIKDGSLVYHTSVGDVAEQIPSAYIQHGTTQRKVECEYSVNGHDIAFDIKGADISGQEFVIDPALVFSTFSNSSASAFGCNGSYDSNGNAFGSAVVNGQGWPTSVGAYDVSYAGSTDFGIHKFNPVNASSIWATYIGGTSSDYPLAMLCNSNDEVFVLGMTSSTDFPVGTMAYDASFNGSNDVTVSKLSADGTQLLNSTFVGGSGDEGNVGTLTIAGNEMSGDFFLDGQGNPVVACATSSTNFPIVGAYQSANSGGYDGCVFKLNNALNGMVFSTYLGGMSDDVITGIAEDQLGNILLTGATTSSNFPTSPGAYQGAKLGTDMDAFVSILDASGASLLNSTFFGPSTNSEKGFRIGANSAGDIFVFGSALGTIPVSPGVYSNQVSGNFVAKFDPLLANLLLCTAYGNGSNALCMTPSAFNIDDCDHIFCVGYTTGSQSANMPTTPGAYQATSIDNQDIYINVFTKNMDTLLYGTYIGSSTYEHSHGGYNRFDHNGNLYFALCTQSSFPVTSPTYCSYPVTGGYDMICFKMTFTDLCIAINPPVPDFLCSQSNICPGSCVNFSNFSTNATSYLWSFPGGTPSTSTAANPTNICFSAPGTYNISLTATNSGGSVTLTRASLITVYVPVPVSLVQTGDTIFATPGFILYEWFYNGVPVTSGQQPWYVPTQNGTYTVTALDNHDCASDFTLPNVIASVDNGLSSDQGISIYPNPSSGSFTIEIATGKGWKQFTLTDVTGKVLVDEKIDGNKIIIDRQKISLSSAVYLCRFRSETGSAARKIIIE